MSTYYFFPKLVFTLDVNLLSLTPKTILNRERGYHLSPIDTTICCHVTKVPYLGHNNKFAEIRLLRKVVIGGEQLCQKVVSGP